MGKERADHARDSRANASPHAPLSHAHFSHRQSLHERAPFSSTHDALPQAALMHHWRNLRSCGAEGLAARREKEKGAACQVTARCATRERSLTSATDAPQSAPHANVLVEHEGASTCDVQHSGEHCVAVWLFVAVGAAHRSQNAPMAAPVWLVRHHLAVEHVVTTCQPAWRHHASWSQSGCIRRPEAPFPKPQPSMHRRKQLVDVAWMPTRRRTQWCRQTRRQRQPPASRQFHAVRPGSM